jgi:hypothetical protein
MQPIVEHQDFVLNGALIKPERSLNSRSRRCCRKRPETRDSSTQKRARGRRANFEEWCCQTGLNCRPLHYQWSALPLSYGSMRPGPKAAHEAGRSLPQGPQARKRGPCPAMLAKRAGIRARPADAFKVADRVGMRAKLDVFCHNREQKILPSLQTVEDATRQGQQGAAIRKGRTRCAPGTAEACAARESQAKKIARQGEGRFHDFVAGS